MATKAVKAASPVKALAQEAKQEKNDRVSFVFDGDTYEMDRLTEDFWDDVDVLEAFEAQQAITLLKLIVGPANWMLFKSKKRTSEDLDEFSRLAFGATMGESEAS